MRNVDNVIYGSQWAGVFRCYRKRQFLLANMYLRAVIADLRGAQ